MIGRLLRRAWRDICGLRPKPAPVWIRCRIVSLEEVRRRYDQPIDSGDPEMEFAEFCC